MYLWPIVAQGHGCATVNALGCEFDSHEEIKVVIFSYPRSGTEAKGAVDF